MPGDTVFQRECLFFSWEIALNDQLPVQEVHQVFYQDRHEDQNREVSETQEFEIAGEIPGKIRQDGKQEQAVIQVNIISVSAQSGNEPENCRDRA